MTRTANDKEVVRRRQSRMQVEYVMEDVPPDQQELVILENKVVDLETHNDMLNRSCKKLCDNQDALKRSFATDKFILEDNHAKEKQSLLVDIQKLKDEVYRLKLQNNEDQAEPRGILKKYPSGCREEVSPRTVYILRFELRGRRTEDEAETMGVFPDVNSANKAAVTAYKQKCDSWESLPIADFGISDDRLQGHGDHEPGAHKWHTGGGEVRYAFSEDWTSGHGLVSVERHIVGGVGLENEDYDSDLPYHPRGAV
ncbi:hypothetical protein DOTSEDRAFT_38607 [Dothistroma septosporum NZE10]|uniref:Uncharacterized protein n=1 Tax=Dothistroma septosporum (strain NZE10 / CBS 128990) TaxID=675120 RepID=M2YKB1_DOTSN|nr:hypothetical protein DOTSEDRAFT_38607 [Dothistroma septosporum NZE10]